MKRIALVLFIMFSCLSFLLSQTPKPEEIQLSLQDCILKTLEDNLDISIQALYPEISTVNIDEAKEKFYPKLSVGFTNRDNTTLGSWGVEGTKYKTKSDFLTFSLDQKISIGTDISLSFNSSTTDTTRAFTIINPSYYSLLRVDITQPLLKNFGPKTNRWEIIKAENLKDISDFDLKLILREKTYEVEEAYWNLVYSIENLKVMELSLRQSQDRSERTKRAERIGVRSPLDVLSAETEVANYENRVLSSQLLVERNQDRLKSLLNFQKGEMSFKKIIPLDTPTVEKKVISFEQAVNIAVAERPELARIHKELENNILDISYYKNQLLPQLNLDFSLWYPGQSGVRNIYLDNDPFTGIIIDKIEGGRLDSFNDIINWRYPNWQISLTLNLALENVFSRARLVQSRIEKDQNELEAERIRTNIYYEVLDAFKELKNKEHGIDTSARYRELTERKLEAEEGKYNLGLAGSEWVLQYQRDLAQARADEIRAIIDYKIAAAKLEKILGINLRTKNIQFRNLKF